MKRRKYHREKTKQGTNQKKTKSSLYTSSKSKQKKQFLKCPSCLTARYRTEITTILSELEALERKLYKSYNEMEMDSYESLIVADFDWACDVCLQTNKAIRANPGSQNYCWSPNMAYFDSHFLCQKCGDEFIFSKEEKKFWYEELKFWIDSIPVNCSDCRKEIRQLKMENKTLSDLLKKDQKEISTEELEKVISIYETWKKEDRAKYYRSVLSKRKKVRNK